MLRHEKNRSKEVIVQTPRSIRSSTRVKTPFHPGEQLASSGWEKRFTGVKLRRMQDKNTGILPGLTIVLFGNQTDNLLH